ncbi:MAG TPA: phage holin family protein, partial [Solirubrobacterales bacterium]|nr:phage holin family protein [Solirubrobacterales bacterium]
MTVSRGSSNELRSHSTGELVKQLSEQASTLARQEVELAKAELTEKARTAGTGAGMFGGAGLLGLLALGALTAS